MNNYIQKTLDLVFSSKRRMPAHFSSDKDRVKSFSIDFKDLSKEDEYEMASEAWYSLKTKKKIDDFTLSAIVKTGEDIMLGSFIITKLGQLLLGNELKEKIFNHNLKNFGENNDLKIIFRDREIASYFEHCVEFGKKRAMLVK